MFIKCPASVLAKSPKAKSCPVQIKDNKAGSWKKCFMIFYNCIAYFYKDEKDDKPFHCIDMSRANVMAADREVAKKGSLSIAAMGKRLYVTSVSESGEEMEEYKNMWATIPIEVDFYRDASHKGWLKQRGEDLFKSYKKVFCILAGNLMYCLEKEDAPAPKTGIYLTNSQIEKIEGKTPGFKVTIKGEGVEKSYFFQGENDDEVSTWVVGLTLASSPQMEEAYSPTSAVNPHDKNVARASMSSLSQLAEGSYTFNAGMNREDMRKSLRF